jgi:hypothetical protein
LFSPLFTKNENDIVSKFGNLGQFTRRRDVHSKNLKVEKKTSGTISEENISFQFNTLQFFVVAFCSLLLLVVLE